MLKKNDFNEYEKLLKQYHTLDKMLKLYKKMQKNNPNLTLLELENKIYKKLDEKEKLLYEINRIKKLLNKNELILKNQNLNELFKNTNVDSKENIDEFKKQILKTEIDLGMKVGLYSASSVLFKEVDEKIKRLELNNERNQ